MSSDECVKLTQKIMSRKMGEWKTYNDKGYGLQLVAYKNGMLIGNFEMLTTAESQEHELITEWCIVRGSYSHFQMPVKDVEKVFTSQNVIVSGAQISNFKVKHRSVVRLEPHFFSLPNTGTYTVRIDARINAIVTEDSKKEIATIILYNVTREGLYSFGGNGADIIIGGCVSLVGHEHGKAPPEAQKF